MDTVALLARLDRAEADLKELNRHLMDVNRALCLFLSDREKYLPMLEAARVQFFPEGKFKRPSLFGG